MDIVRSALQLKRIRGAGRGSVAGASSWACSREAQDGIKLRARSILGYSCQTLASMRGLGLSSSVVPIMNGAMRASGADAGAENGCPAANKALLLTRKANGGVAGRGQGRGDACGLEDLGHRAAERQPLCDGVFFRSPASGRRDASMDCPLTLE
jgi:hypothetical protein